jgi:predicted permease
VADIDLRPHGYDTDRTRSFWKDILDRVRALPGVEQAGLAQWPLLAGGSSNGSDVRTEQTGTAEPNRTNARFDPVDAAWFDVLRVPVITGRGFNESDDAAAPPVIIINETLAARLWPGENPLGRVVLGAGAPREVVGITRAGKYVFIGEPPTSIVFFPYEQRLPGRMTLHVRARVTAGAGLIDRIRAEVLAIDPDIAIENTGSLSAMVGVSMFPLRFAASLIGGFGLAGLILAMIGVYGVLAFEVARSTREFGIRGALGARARDLIGAIVARGLAVAAVGTAAGIGIAVAVTRFIRGFLYGVGPLDPLTFVAAGLLMLAVAVAAAWLPARRASSVPPIVALRAE